MSGLKYGLNMPKKSQAPSKPVPPAGRRPVFGDDDDSEPERADAAPADNSKTMKKKSGSGAAPSKPPGTKPKSKVSMYGDLSATSSSREQAEQAEALDPSIYDYDAAYDALHARDEAKKAAAKADAQERKPKYMGSLLAAAETRKRDQLRAKEKMLQREREQEGDEFADKEKFVTAAYKAQQEEMKRLEEEERQREEQEERMKGKVGMRGFYRNMMDSDEQRHREMIEAMQEGQKGAPKKEDDEASKEKTEAELAREMNEKGAKVILNDEGQVADKRQLLSAGLNVRAKPKVAAPAPTLPSRTSDAQQAYQGRNSDKRGMRERQSRMIERQLEEAAKRAADEEDEKRRELEHKAKSRKTEKDVSSAKERYLQRKREKELEAAAAKGT